MVRGSGCLVYGLILLGSCQLPLRVEIAIEIAIAIDMLASAFFDYDFDTDPDFDWFYRNLVCNGRLTMDN